jgi:hypothetical protein
VPALVRLIYDKDARVRAAADQALVALIQGHPDVTGTVDLLLEHLWYVRAPTCGPCLQSY